MLGRATDFLSILQTFALEFKKNFFFFYKVERR